MFVSGANLNVLIARTVLFVELLFPDTFQLISQTAVTSSKWMVATRGRPIIGQADIFGRYSAFL